MLPLYQSVKRKEPKALLGVGTAGVCLLVVCWYFWTSGARAAVDPLVGSANWAKGVQRQTSLGVYRVWDSSDFKGGDLSFKEAKSVDECMYFCDSTPECIYFALWNGLCYLKDTPTRFETFKNRPRLFAGKRVAVHPIAGKEYSDAETKTTTASTYKIWQNTAFSDNEQGASSLQANLEGCLHACDADANCIHVTFDGRHCRVANELKAAKRVTAAGTTAAFKVRMHNAPDPLVKQHWTKSSEVATAHSVYKTWQGCQFKGADIIAVKANTLKDCLDECDAELYCHHVTFVGKECMLKGWAPDYFEILSSRTDVWAAKQIETHKQEQSLNIFHTGYTPNAEDLGDLHNDFLVGEHYDESYAYETKFSRYRVWDGFDFNGGDLHSNSLQLQAYTLESCLAECDHKPECSHIVLIDGKECWLKGRPFQLSRMLDDRKDVHAAMKLGRVGKMGIDARTQNKQDRRSGSSFAYNSYMYGMDSFSYNFRSGDSSGSGSGLSLWSVLLFVLCGGGTFWLVATLVSYWSRVQGGFYVSELA